MKDRASVCTAGTKGFDELPMVMWSDAEEQIAASLTTQSSVCTAAIMVEQASEMDITPAESWQRHTLRAQLSSACWRKHYQGLTGGVLVQLNERYFSACIWVLGARIRCVRAHDGSLSSINHTRVGCYHGTEVANDSALCGLLLYLEGTLRWEGVFISLFWVCCDEVDLTC